MKTNPISTKNTNFSGNIIVKNAISSNQNYLFNLHKDNLTKMIKDMPFDLFVEQSKSKKTISLSTGVEGANAYIVRKNKQNFEEAAYYAIEDAKKKSELYKKTVKINEIFENGKFVFANVILGNFKIARDFEKKFAELAVKDFEVYKQIPKINFIGVPTEIQKMALKNGLKYRIFKLFQTKTPEEKTFSKMRKEYIKELKSENKQIKTINIEFPRCY